MENNSEKYIGKTFKGFAFEHKKHNNLFYNLEMDEFVGRELKIISCLGNDFYASNGWHYPADLVIAQIEANGNDKV